MYDGVMNNTAATGQNPNFDIARECFACGARAEVSKSRSISNYCGNAVVVMHNDCARKTQGSWLDLA